MILCKDRDFYRRALKLSGYIALQNVSKVCELLDCQPGDLMEFVKEAE